MLRGLKPDYQVSHFQEISASWLKEKGKICLICDIDNTLCVHDEIMTQKVADYLLGLEEQGIRVILVSNNTRKRVDEFLNQKVFDTYSFALKPLPFTYCRIRKKVGLDKKKMICMGDQLFTDILGGKFFGISTILCEPLSEKDIIYTRLTRWLENLILKRKR